MLIQDALFPLIWRIFISINIIKSVGVLVFLLLFCCMLFHNQCHDCVTVCAESRQSSQKTSIIPHRAIHLN